MTEHLKPLDPDVAEALAAERGRPGSPPGVRQRAFARLLAAVDGGGGDPESGGSSGAGEARDLSPPDLESISPGGAAASSASTAAAALRAHPFVTGGIGFVCGLVSGAALYAHFVAPGPASPVVVAEVATSVVGSKARAEVRHPAPPPAPSSQPDSPASPAQPREAPASAPSSGADPTAERALLDVARAARGRGEPQAALDALNQHQKRYAWGVFREEREALAIQSLRDLGRLDEAQRRARAFRTRYPKSLFLTSVERVLESNP
jgi:hypothetical protein